jgi:hypothetical protein
MTSGFLLLLQLLYHLPADFFERAHVAGSQIDDASSSSG